MILKFDGKLVCEWDFDNMSLSIGGRDVFAAVQEATFSGRVTVAIGDASFTGDTLSIDKGTPGYSEYTPGSPAEFVIGRHNIFPLLADMDGQTVTLWIADEPFNTLDPPPQRPPAPPVTFGDASTQTERQLIETPSGERRVIW